MRPGAPLASRGMTTCAVRIGHRAHHCQRQGQQPEPAHIPKSQFNPFSPVLLVKGGGTPRQIGLKRKRAADLDFGLVMTVSSSRTLSERFRFNRGRASPRRSPCRRENLTTQTYRCHSPTAPRGHTSRHLRGGSSLRISTSLPWRQRSHDLELAARRRLCRARRRSEFGGQQDSQRFTQPTDPLPQRLVAQAPPRFAQLVDVGAVSIENRHRDGVRGS